MASAQPQTSSNEPPQVEVLGESNIPTIPFAVALPPSTFQQLDDPSPLKASVNALIGEKAIVGSIVLMGNAAMIWVGWGSIDTNNVNHLESERMNGFGTGAPFMGQLVVAMPRTNYKGAFGTGANEPSCSQIIGSADTDDQMLGSQMASRLSMRSKMAIFVSCQLSSGGSDSNDWIAGMDSEMISHRAAALAEKEIWHILQQRLNL